MKRLLLVAILLIVSTSSFAQCPTSALILSTQAQIDNFQTTYPGCTQITDGLGISGADITDLTPLTVLTEVDGGLSIFDNSILTNLSGLENIQTVVSGGGDLQIQNNASLTSITDLIGLTGPVGSSITIDDNPLLSSLQGLNNVTRPGDDDLIIINNDALTSLSGLNSMVQSDDILIWDNDNLTSLAGLGNNHTTGQFLLWNNDALTTLTGLPNLNPLCGFEISDHALLTDIDGFADTFIENCSPSIVITNNPSLATCAIDFICEVLPFVFNLDVSNNASGCDTPAEATMHCTVCPTSDLVLSSQQQIDEFAAFYPNCSTLNVNLTISGSDISDLSGLSQITTIQGLFVIRDNPILTNFSGMTALAIESSIEIENNPLLTNIDGLNGITGTSLLYLSLKDNPLLGSISPLTTVVGFADIEIDNNDSLINLDGLQGTTESEILLIYNNQLLEDISALGNISGSASLLEVGSNPSLLSLTGLEGFTDCNLDLIIFENNLIQNLDGLSGLTNALTPPISTNVSIDSNALLSDISGIENMDSDTWNTLDIMDNPLLSVCEILPVCNFVGGGGFAVIANNAPGCNTAGEITNACGLALNFINGNVKFDFNMDGCNTNDIDVQSILISFTDGTDTMSTATDAEGNYSLFIPWEGLVTTSTIAASLPPNFEATPVSIDTNFVGFGNSETIDFCLTATTIFDDLRITLLPINDARPGFDAHYQLVYENLGTTILSGEVSLEFDDSRQSFLTAIPAEDDITGNEIRWDYVDLLPFESRTIDISFNTLPPPTNESGDELWFTSQVMPDANDISPEDNVYTLLQIIVNSQDPNDKLVTQGAEIYQAEVGNYLDYIVRFQNIGSASAINVRVDDELSANLDWDTFRILSTSHEYRLEIIDGNQVSFIFDGINLPSVNTDPEGSNGYIAFQVRSLETLTVGDSVENSANIFFDFNPPIETNTVTTIVVENLGVTELPLDQLIEVYPNPVSEELRIQLADGVHLHQVTLYSMLGESLIFSSEKSIDVSSFSEGIYFLRIQTSEGTIIKKVIKD